MGQGVARRAFADCCDLWGSGDGDGIAVGVVQCWGGMKKTREI